MATATHAPSSSNRLVGRGKAFFGRHDAAGLFVGFTPLGNTVECFVRATVETLENRSSMDADSRLLDQIGLQTDLVFSLKTQEINKKNAALALFGTEGEYTQATGSNIVEVVTPAGGIVKGNVYALSSRPSNIDSVSDVTGALVENVDYRWVDAAKTAIWILGTGAAHAGEALTVQYDRAAITAGSGIATVAPGKSSFIYGSFLFLGDPAYGPLVEARGWRASVKPTDALALITGRDISLLSLDFTCLDDSVGLYGGSVAFPLGEIKLP